MDEHGRVHCFPFQLWAWYDLNKFSQGTSKTAKKPIIQWGNSPEASSGQEGKRVHQIWPTKSCTPLHFKKQGVVVSPKSRIFLGKKDQGWINPANPPLVEGKPGKKNIANNTFFPYKFTTAWWVAPLFCPKILSSSKSSPVCCWGFRLLARRYHDHEIHETSAQLYNFSLTRGRY